MFSRRKVLGVGFKAKGLSVDRLSVLVMFSWQYLLMAFLACLGIVQLAAARSGRRHLWLLRRRRATRLLGVVLVVGGIALFYLLPLWMAGPWGLGQVDGSATWATASLQSLTAARNINDTAGGLSGHWQALWVSLAWIAAVFFARAVGRIGNLTGAEDRPPDQEKRVLADVTAGEQR